MNYLTKKQILFFSPLAFILCLLALQLIPTQEETHREKAIKGVEWSEIPPEFLMDKYWRRQSEKSSIQECGSYYGYYMEGKKAQFYGDLEPRVYSASYRVYGDYIEVKYAGEIDYLKIHNEHLDLYEKNFKQKYFALTNYLTEKICVKQN